MLRKKNKMLRKLSYMYTLIMATKMNLFKNFYCNTDFRHWNWITTKRRWYLCKKLHFWSLQDKYENSDFMAVYVQIDEFSHKGQ